MAAPLLKRIQIKLYYYSHPFCRKYKVRLEGCPEVHCPEKLTIGKDVSINGDVFMQCHGGIYIGDSVTISRGVTLLTYGLSTENYKKNIVNKTESHFSKPIVIGSGVWLCANVVVTMGVTIAPYCVIAAGAVVTKDCEVPNALYGGVPARFIKFL